MKNADRKIEVMEPLSPRTVSSDDTRKKSFIDKHFAPASMKGAVFNIIPTIIGSAILAFPFAMRQSGLLFGVVLLMICTYFAYISLNLLAMSANFLSMQNKNVLPSFLCLSLQCNGDKLATFVELNVLLSLLSGIISRMVAVGGVIVILYEDFFDGAIKVDVIEDNLPKFFIIGFTILIVFPLSLLRNMSSLRFTSSFSVIRSLFLTICLFIEYFVQSDNYFAVFTMNNYGKLMQFSWSGLVTAVPIFLFGYNCQESIFPIYREVKNKTPSKMRKIFRLAVGISSMFYFIAGSSGFLLFLHHTCGNILLNDFNLSQKMMASSITFSVAMILAIPIKSMV